MKRWIAGGLIVLMLCACVPGLAENWYCPYCGRLNDNNYCPYDGTKKPENGNNQGNPGYQQYYGNYTSYAYQIATLNRRLATRTGPSTDYDEPGSFLAAGYQVTVLSKAYDTRNEIWWVQVEFSENGARYRAYTGVKRFSDLNLQWIPEEKAIGSCRVPASIAGYYGPSYEYKEIARKIPAGVQCTIYGYAYGGSSDFIQIEFLDGGNNQLRRAWVPDWAVDNLYIYNGYSGYNGYNGYYGY